LGKGADGLTLLLITMGPKTGMKVTVWQLSSPGKLRSTDRRAAKLLVCTYNTAEEAAGHGELSCPSCESSGIGHR